MLKKTPVKNSEKVSVTFAVEDQPSADQIHLVGDFNDWEPERTPMKQRKDGAWSVAVRLDKDQRYEYRFVVDGDVWCADEMADELVPNPFGGHNSVVAL